jgi:hypothetical protein
LSLQYLYVFLDEAGDFNFSVTGTKFFTFTTITKTRPFLWDTPLISLKYDLIEVGLDIEYFHAAEDRQAVRDKVFAIIGNNLGNLRIDSLVIEKRKTGPALQVLEKFYPRMIGYLLRYVLDPKNLKDFSEVIVITDSIPVSRKREAIEKAVKQTLSKMLPTGTKYRVLHHASKSCVGLQIADYCNWAIFRKLERQDLRSYELIRSGIRSEFDIFRPGMKYYY